MVMQRVLSSGECTCSRGRTSELFVPVVNALTCVQVVNKYLLADGACPKSYGPTVARAAGVPVAVTKRAAEISELFEKGNLPVQQHMAASAPPEGFAEVWGACNSASPPDVTSLQHLQGKVAELNSARIE